MDPKKSRRLRDKRRYDERPNYFLWKTFCQASTKRGGLSDRTAWERIEERKAALGNVCEVCGVAENIHLDHKIPASRGGPGILANLALLCRDCNRAKGDMSVREFASLVVRMLPWASRRLAA